MKSQDLFILLKLVSLDQQIKQHSKGIILPADNPNSWAGWIINESPDRFQRQQPEVSDVYSNRALATSTGVSKSEVNASLKRSIAVGLLHYSETTRYPRVNITALLEFIIHGMKYVFPATPSAIRRGIPTAFAAPALVGLLADSPSSVTASKTEFIHIWPDALGKEKGQAITPLFKTVPKAVKKDLRLYQYLALVDAIRLDDDDSSQRAKKELGKLLRNR